MREIGFGPGLALQRAAALAHEGFVFGLDRSPLMLRTVNAVCVLARAPMSADVGTASTPRATRD